MVRIVRTDSENPDFIDLVKYLDADLAEKDGEQHLFYGQLNRVGLTKHVVVAYEEEKSVGCGAVREHGADAMEVKRMYVSPESRG